MTYDFSTLYTTFPHNSIKEKNFDLIEWTFKREGTLYLACNDKNALFSPLETIDGINFGLVRIYMTPYRTSCIRNIYIRLSTKLYRLIVGIQMGTNCAPLVADLFLFCYERDFMTTLSDDNQADINEAFNSTSTCR